jgi:nucleotide-binding universal stress UspA family protein
MKTVLVLTDFSKKAEHAAEMAIKIAVAANAKVQLHSTFHAPQVFPSDAGATPFFEDYTAEEEAANDKLKELEERLKEKFGNETLPRITCTSAPGNLADTVENLGPWLMVMGGKSRVSALSEFVFGSNTSAVMDRASCPVLIVPEKAQLDLFKKIVFASALSPAEKGAMSFVEEFKSILNAQITVLHVNDKQTEEENPDEQSIYYNSVVSVNQPAVQYTDVRGADIAEAINDYARHEAIDLIAIAHAKPSFFGQLFHKSVGKNMVNYQDLPVLILHKQ